MAPAFRFAAAVASAVCSRSESVLPGEKQPDSRRRHAPIERTRTMMVRMQLESNGLWYGKSLSMNFLDGAIS
jgi:hypothetical protein